ncbi:hypothetical protein SAMN05421858_4274 [Haladaptatus litoreus]|uniref:Uncharacterized protein n=1 Tax=Haladaptatus litoreus TaxID=553468 RepID=A0A1N7EIH6_9EURY|nr:hypothetical protein [Haladaptatus litoreus]SIR87788.1 hypothetical protein SAMN05421858_4274 [Haladaptatus litoreus]
MGLETIIQIAEQVGEDDEARRAAFRRELQQYDDGEIESFTETNDTLAAERETLNELKRELDSEEGNIEELVEYTEFLTVEQAVEHREETVDKLGKHNKHLRTFHAEMIRALDIVETNLDTLEANGREAVCGNPQPHFERAGEALKKHNEAVEGLGTNMTILNAYIV